LVRLGLIARADFGRGLAHQTHSFYEHLKPDVTVVVDIELIDYRQAWPQDFSLYPDAIVSKWKGYTADFENPEALDALASCDIVYTAETYYDERVPLVTDTILHVNPELFRGQRATQYWYPTSWRTKDLPPGDLIPTPIRDSDIALEVPGPGTILHVAGHHAVADRNGTKIVQGLISQERLPWRITFQDGANAGPRMMQWADVVGRVEDRWSLFEGSGILCYPRRYGGQSLVVNEAMARGLVVVMPNCEPNLETWPIIPIPHRPSGYVQTPGGRLQMFIPETTQMIDSIKALLADDELLDAWQARSLMWARDNSWEIWEPKIRALL
jgi:hypothetical protein